MRLIDAARFFDSTVCVDAYTLGNTFMAQLDLYDDSKRDGVTVDRRVLSLADSIVLPARGAFNALNEVFLLGAVHKDSFGGTTIRRKYVCHRADGLASVNTLEQAILGTVGGSAYAARLWVKDNKEVVVSSRLDGFFNIYFSSTETIAVGSVVTIDGRAHLVRNSFVNASGFLLCEADELPITYVSAVVYTDKSGQAYDAAADALGALGPVSCSALWHRFQSGYEYLRPSADKFEPGDITANVSKTNIPAAGANDRFTLLGDTWRVLAVRDNGANVWMLHARRV